MEGRFVVGFGPGAWFWVQDRAGEEGKLPRPAADVARSSVIPIARSS